MQYHGHDFSKRSYYIVERLIDTKFWQPFIFHMNELNF